MTEICQRLTDHARVSFERVLLRRMMFVGGCGIGFLYYDPLIACLGFVSGLIADIVDMRASAAVLRDRTRLPGDPVLCAALRWRLRLTGGALTLCVAGLAAALLIRAGPDLQSTPFMFLLIAALYWSTAQPQLPELARDRRYIIGGGGLICALWWPLALQAPLSSPLWIQAVTVGFCLYFVFDSGRAFEDRYDLRLKQTAAIQKALSLSEQVAHRRSDLLRILSHELRTPLNGILGMAELLRLGSLSPGQAQQVGAIHESGQRLSSVLSDVMDSERLESGRLRIVKAPCDAAARIRDVVDRHRSAAECKGLSLTFEADPTHAPVMVVVDADRLAQAADNLVSNAIKFTDIGGIVVACKQDRGSTPPMLTLTVTDTGCGMSPDSQTRLFHPFAQIDMSETREQQGAGLGLWITRYLADLMGGSLEVESTAGLGTRFTLKIIADAAQPNHQVMEMRGEDRPSATDAGRAAQGSGQAA